MAQTDTPEYRFILAGEQRAGAPYTVACPYDGAPVGTVHRAGPDELEQAIQAAVAAFEVTRMLPGHKRAAVLRKVSELIAARAEPLARMIALEAGKPIKQARVEVGRSAATFAAAADEATRFHDELLHLDATPGGEGRQGIVRRFPIGPIAAISPFNFPLNLVGHKLAPAIAAGCPVVLKPASATPLTALKLAALLLDECGLPDGWLNVVTCSGKTANHLVTHDDVAMITFTGSPPVGWGIRAAAPRKRVGLELGNNAPVVIEPDGDWSGAAAKISVAGYSFAGQSCISVQRVFVHSSIHDAFVAELVAKVDALKVGDPASDDTEISALINKGETERVHKWVDEAVSQGATIAAGGRLDGDGVLVPTVLTDVVPDMEVCRDEVFGPVVGVQAYDDFDEALRLANDSRYGLQAAVFTSDIGKALNAARTLD